MLLILWQITVNSTITWHGIQWPIWNHGREQGVLFIFPNKSKYFGANFTPWKGAWQTPRICEERAVHAEDILRLYHMVVSSCASSTAEVPNRLQTRHAGELAAALSFQLSISTQFPADISPTRLKISTPSQNECKTVVRVSTHVKLQGKKRNCLLFQKKRKKYSQSKDPHWWVRSNRESTAFLCSGKSKAEVCTSWPLPQKGAVFAPQPLSAFLRFFPFMLCRSGLEVTTESTGSWKITFSDLSPGDTSMINWHRFEELGTFYSSYPTHTKHWIPSLTLTSAGTAESVTSCAHSQAH